MRPKDSPFDKLVKEAFKQLKKDIDTGKVVTRTHLAQNMLMFEYLQHGLEDISHAKDAAKKQEGSGFKMVINSMFRKALEGDMRAIKMVMNMAGLDVDNVETDANTESNTFTLNYKL